MQLTIKNKNLVTLMTVLEKIEVRNMRANRGRAKLFSRVSDKLNDYIKDETDILKEYVEMSDDGQFKRDAAGNLVLKEAGNAQEVNQFLKELQQEEVIIKGGEYSKRYGDFLDFLSDYDGELTIEEIEVVDDLLEQYEASKVKKGEE